MKMRAAFTAKSDFIQKNYYFDTPDFDLKNSDASLRIKFLLIMQSKLLKLKKLILRKRNTVNGSKLMIYYL